MVIIPIFLGVIGLAFGSFVGALVWRLHAGKDFVNDRSECEHCHHKLGPLDLIPLFSWLSLGGKCRYCKKPIGISAPLYELTMAALFVGSYYLWPYTMDTWQGNLVFGMWLIYLVGLMALFVYDLRYMLLPNVLVYPLIGVAIVESAFRLLVVQGMSPVDYFNYVLFGVIALGGLYWVLYTFSKGKWVGYGDVKLGIFMGIALGFQRSVLALVVANVIAFLIVLPGLLTGKLKRTSRVPFGPFLIAAFAIAFLVGDKLIDWYLHFIYLK